ncbi:hypothetical protein KALB_4882 [Kutzneria albida DSM 43870]|uniref:Uncharacterized protein n=1 Tax=Kutzneria albida DSM 43870 TaxID=1449976 RepID=W5WJA6_9PSEU|nr:hypothetical protein KALB_4882 [Kutzneria albida DSM 43870]
MNAESASKYFAIYPDNCKDCGGPFYDTACDAPGCVGRACLSCGVGCDWELAEGSCRQSVAGESNEDRVARVNAERAAFGLSPVRADGEPQP